MRKRFASNLLLLLFLNFLVKPLWIFGIDRHVQNLVGAEEYGLYFALFNFSFLFNILLDLGLTHYNNQAVARNKVQVVRNFSNLTSLKCLLGVAYLIATLIAGLIVGYRHLAFNLLCVLAVNQFLSSMILFFRSHLAGLQFFRADSILSVIDKSLMIIFCGALLFTRLGPDDFNIGHFILAQTASYLTAVLIAFFLVRRKVRIFSWRIDLAEYGRGLRKSFPYALLILLMALYTRVDGIMLDRMVGSYESGVYAAAFRLLDMINQMSYLFGTLLLPMFAGMIGRGENMSRLTEFSFSLLFTLLLLVCLISLSHGEYFMDALYDNKDISIAIIFKILMVSALAFGSTFIFGTLLTADGRLKTLNTIAVTGFIVNVVLNFLLIPGYGAEGAAVATLSTQLLTAIAQAIYSFKLGNIVFSKFYGIRLLLFVVLSIGLSLLVGSLEATVFISIGLVTTGTLAIAAFLSLLNYKAAIVLLKTRFK